ncbi:unnamed protein product [Aphis gossypii]|uniref:Uncharacterized protein n=1 Tax=Aphis gossypii TaxID=80765 RepID=A0A9P0ISH2_APHGO|nr:unnamed protein product [Aphis gossypii]
MLCYFVWDLLNYATILSTSRTVERNVQKTIIIKKGKDDNEPAAFRTDEKRLARLVSAAERLPFAVCAGSIGRQLLPSSPVLHFAPPSHRPPPDTAAASLETMTVVTIGRIANANRTTNAMGEDKKNNNKQREAQG